MVEEEIRESLENIKRKRKWAIRWFTWGWGLWFIETVIFLGIYGWHITPADPVEKVCDHITGIMMIIGFVKMINVMWKTDQLIIEAIDDDE